MMIQNVVKKVQLRSASLGTRALALFGLLLALTGPFLLLTNGGRELANLPWYLWVVLPVLLVLVFGAGVLMFRHESHHAEDISISPDRKGTERRL